MNNNLSREKTGVQRYDSPVCMVIHICSESLICISGDDSIQGTEVVDEIEGIW